jgi:DNA-directed RNA polymerase subunit beta
MENVREQLIGMVPRHDIVDPATGQTVVEATGRPLTEAEAERVAALPPMLVAVQAIVTKEIEYLSADIEDRFIVAQANSPVDEHGHFAEDRVLARQAGRFVEETPERIDYMDVSPKQVFSISTALIPFLEHDDANRALMGANMQRQAVPRSNPGAGGQRHGSRRWPATRARRWWPGAMAWSPR